MRHNRGSVVSIVVMVFAAIMAFNIAFLFFAHQAGLYSIVRKKPEPPPRPGVTDIDRMVALLNEEKRVLEEKQAALALQQQEVEEVKKQIDLGDKSLEKRKADIAQVLDDISKSIKVREAEKEKRLVELVKTFSAMKPAEVVPVFEKLDPETTAAIIMRMKPKVSAKILEKMAPRQAGLITEMIKRK